MTGMPSQKVQRDARSSSWSFVRDLGSRLTTARALGVSAEMAFWLFLSLLPLAAVAGLAASKVAIGNSWLTASMLDSLPAATRTLIYGELGRMAAWNGGKVGLAAGFMFAWLASSGVHSLFDGIELETEATPRSWTKKRLIAIGACVALSIGVAILALLGTGVGWVQQLLDGAPWIHAPSASVAEKIVRYLAGAGLSIALIYGLYWVGLPPATRKTMPLLPGAILATVLQVVIGFGYGFYISKAGDGGAYQAGLASIGVTMMALYLFCFVLLAGVELNQMLGERAAPPGAVIRAHRSLTA